MLSFPLPLLASSFQGQILAEAVCYEDQQRLQMTLSMEQEERADAAEDAYRTINFKVLLHERASSDTSELWSAATEFWTRSAPWPQWAGSILCSETEQDPARVVLTMNRGVLPTWLAVFDIDESYSPSFSKPEGTLPEAPMTTPAPRLMFEFDIPFALGGIREVRAVEKNEKIRVTLSGLSRVARHALVEVDLATRRARIFDVPGFAEWDERATPDEGDQQVPGEGEPNCPKLIDDVPSEVTERCRDGCSDGLFSERSRVERQIAEDER